MSAMADSAERIVIEGRVQGVGFRAWAMDEAERRSIRGWVRNRRDGTVEALLIAPRDEHRGHDRGLPARARSCPRQQHRA